MGGVLNWGYYPAEDKWVPLKVDADGSIHVVGYVDKLDDIGDVDVAAPTDGYVLYWDDAAGKWKDKLISATKLIDADGDTKVDVEEAADEDKVRMDVKGVEAFHLDDAGVLTLAKQSRARATGSIDQAIANTTWTKVQFDVETYDNQGEYDPVTNYRFTAKTAGYYLVTAAIRYINPTADKYVFAGIYKDGVEYSSGGFHSSHQGYLTAPITDIVPLAIASYIEIWTIHNCGAAENISGTLSHFAVHKLS